MLIASTVLAGSWIYIRSLERIGVEGAVEGLVPASRVLRVLNSRMPFTPAAFEEGSAVLREASAGLEGIISGDGHLLRTPRLFWGPVEEGVMLACSATVVSNSVRRGTRFIVLEMRGEDGAETALRARATIAIAQTPTAHAQDRAPE